MSIAQPYIYVVQRSLRPTRISGSKAFLDLRTDADSVFEWKCLNVEQTYDFLCMLTICGKPFAQQPIRSCNLRGAGPMFLVQPVILQPQSEIAIMIANCLAKDRKWNKVAFTFIGEKVFHESPVTND